jgi:peroxiredoxin
LGISVDPPEASAKLDRDLHLGFSLLSDTDEQVIRRYGLVHSKGHDNSDIARPADLLLDARGVIRWAMFTDDIRVRAHPDALLAAARRMK